VQYNARRLRDNTQINMPDKQYWRDYYQKNKQTIIARNKQKVTCKLCNKTMTRLWYPKHLKSKAHQLVETRNSVTQTTPEWKREVSEMVRKMLEEAQSGQVKT